MAKTASPKTVTTADHKHDHEPKPSDLEQFFSPDPQIKITLAWAQVEPVYQKVLAKAARQLKQPGFRPGKVPPSVAEDLVERDYLVRQVLQELAPAAYQEALRKEKLQPISEPELVVTKADKGADWVLKAHLPQKPKVNLGDYKKSLKKYKAAAEKTLNQEIAMAKKQAAAKKDLSFKEPDAKTLATQITDRALFELLRELEPKVSPILVRRSAQRELQRLQNQLQKQQLVLADYLKSAGLTAQDLETNLVKRAVQNLQLEFILDALLDAEKISVTTTEVKTKIKAHFKDLSASELERQVQEPQVLDYFTLLARREKLAAWLVAL